MKGFLTPLEEEILNNLIEAWGDFIKLESTYPDEAREFSNAIHVAQNIILSRPVKRELK